MLGPLLVQDANGPVVLGSAKQRALLAALLLTAPGRVVTVEELIDDLWGENPPSTGAKALQVQASHLRRALGSHQPIVTRPKGYALEIDASAVDVHRFEMLLAEGRQLRLRGEGDAALRSLDRALREWRGPALSDVTLLGPSAFERQRLNELRTVAREERIELQLEQGAAAALVPELERSIAEDPYREHLYELLMLALYRAGRQADALLTFRRARTLLVEELGLEPGPELLRLEAAVLAHDPDLLRGATEAPSVVATEAPIDREASDAQRRARIPHLTGPILGREAELEAGLTLINGSEARLITLTGAGGIGKTRLAWELARRLEDRSCLVELAAISDSNRVLAAIAAGTGAEEASEAGIAAVLEGTGRVLFLDNFEHVLSAASAISSLLHAAPTLTIVATSRAPLHILGERELPVPPLNESAAVELFVKRAREQAPDFSFTDEDRDQIASICGRLDGLPLAIELAAARTRILSPQEILDRLGSRLDLLTAGRRDAPERHRTLRATIAWSYELLEPSEQRLFAELAVFVSGCSLEDCEAVAERPVVDELAALVDHGLVLRDQARFKMLDTVRAYAGELLDASAEAESIRRRHAAWCLGLAESAEAELEGPGQAVWFTRLAAEQESLGAAATWAVEHDEPEMSLGIDSSLWRFWIARGGGAAALERLTRGLASGRGSPPLRAKALNAAGVLAGEAGEVVAAHRFFEEALDLATQLGERRQMARTLMNLGVIAIYDEDYRLALTRYAEAGNIWRELGDARGQSIMSQNQAIAHALLGEFDEALPLLEKSVELARSVGESMHLAQTLIDLGKHLTQHRPRDSRIASLLHEGLMLLSELGEQRQIIECLEAMAALGAREGSPLIAAELIGSADAERQRAGRQHKGEERPFFEGLVRELKQRLGTEAYEAARAQGAQKDLASAVSMASSLAAKLAVAEAPEAPGRQRGDAASLKR